MNLFQNLKLALAALAMAGLAACGGGGGGGDGGMLRLALTDAPACGYDAVNVTVQKVRVHQSSSAGEADSGWSEIVLNPAKRVNLLDLANGVLAELGQTPLPTGKYTQLRLVLAANDAGNPLANSVLPTGGTEVALATPSASQSGVKTNIDIDIAANKMADFVLDFNACKSVVVAGRSGQYLLKPVLSVVPRYISGVAGFVDASLVGASTGTSLSLQQAGVVIKVTVPSSGGGFLLQPVAPGSYTLVLTAPGRTTAIVTGVLVAAETVTSVNASGNPLNPPLSASGTVNGTSTVDSTVRVLQPLSGGLGVEVAGQFVDGTSGAYSYPLVVAAPLVAPYAVAPGLLLFAADAAAAGKYTLEASLGSAKKTAVLAALTAGATITTHFTLP